ncbi:outer membrane protein assembly factor BamD [Candidatus Babeliales bacterium]|nr:outer membrane protein assembly factor BamD [Candidatus Babeliales bacterium]
MFFLNKNSLNIISLIAVLFLLSSCNKEEKKTEEMSFEELKQKTLSFLEDKKNEPAIENLEKIIAQYPENENISEYKLMLADLYFNTGNLLSASQMYNHYKEFYPSDSKIEFAYYRSVLSKFYQTLKIECDQSDTEKTINLCQEYLDNTLFKAYKNDILDIKKTCEHKLIGKEVSVFNFYLKRGDYDTAANRLKYLKNKHLENNPEIEARLLFLEAKLAQKQKNEDKLNENIEILANKFPDSSFTKMAERLSTKSTFIF